MSASVDRNTQETNTDGVMRVMASIKEADIGVVERAVGEQELAIICGAGHRTVISMRE